MRPMTRLVLGACVFSSAFWPPSPLGLPAHVTVNRSVVINAPESAVVFPYLNNLHQLRRMVALVVARSAIGGELFRPGDGQGRAG